MDELPWYGFFIEKTVDDWSHRYSNYLLIWIMLLLNLDYINCNEVQYLLVCFFYFDFRFIFISFICCDFNHLRASVLMLLNLLQCLRTALLILFCRFFGIYHDWQSGIMMYVFGNCTMTRPKYLGRDYLPLIIFMLNFTRLM